MLEMQDLLNDLSCIQLDMLVKTNNDMISGCQLFENGGNYDRPEVQWYQG
jgi:hypothetical protein